MSDPVKNAVYKMPCQTCQAIPPRVVVLRRTEAITLDTREPLTVYLATAYCRDHATLPLPDLYAAEIEVDDAAELLTIKLYPDGFPERGTLVAVERVLLPFSALPDVTPGDDPAVIAATVLSCLSTSAEVTP